MFAASTQSTSDGIQYEGREWVFEDIDVNTKKYRSGRPVVARIVRNVSGIALLPGRVARFAQGAVSQNGVPGGLWGGQIDGYTAPATYPSDYTAVQSGPGVPIDEFLPTAGVQNNDLCWVVVQGPAGVKTDLATLSPVINVGDLVFAQTAATSQATTAGRIIDVGAVTSNATAIGDIAMLAIGRAMSGPATAAAATTAATANNTDTLVIVDVIRRY